MYNLDLLRADELAHLPDGTPIHPPRSFENPCAKTELLGLPAQGDLERGIITDHRNCQFHLRRIEVPRKREYPALGAVQTGGASQLHDSNWNAQGRYTPCAGRRG